MLCDVFGRYLPSILYRSGHYDVVGRYLPSILYKSGHCDVVGRYLPSILYSATVLRFGHCVMWLLGTCFLCCIVLLFSGLVTL
jgi:hypothetical protein